MSYPYTIYNLRLHWHITFTDVYVSKENPEKWDEMRILRIFPRPDVKDDCTIDEYYNAKLGQYYCIDYEFGNGHFMLPNMDAVCMKAFEIFNKFQKDKEQKV